MSSAGFTNVSVQKFASEGDMALFERNWDEHSELVLKKLGQRGLLSFTAHKIVNQDQDLTRISYLNTKVPKQCKHVCLFGRNLRLHCSEISR